MTKLQQLKWFSKQARRNGYKVSGGSNGGGWLRLSVAIGAPCTTKSAAKQALRRRFGDPAIFSWQKNPAAPVTIIKSSKPRKRTEFAATDAFLESYEWRRVRMEVLIRDGRRCACCGATPDDGLKMHVDHIKPRKHYPQLALDASNLQVLCEVCNHGKGNWDETDWKKEKPAANDPLTEEQRQHLRSIVEGA